MRDHRMGRGLLAGLAGGLAAVAVMYLAADVTGVQPLTRRLQEPLLSVMPGPVFGFLIDRLQHLGKVLEEIGLIAGMLLVLAAGGGLYARLHPRLALPHLALLIGLAAWLAAGLVLLPASGGGLFGLADGIAAPVVLLAAFAVYAVVMELAWNRADASAEEADPGRRRVLLGLPIAVAAVSAAVVGVRLGPGWYRAAFQPAEAGLSGQTPELTPPGNFYVVSKNFSDPAVDERGWALNVRGLVDRPFRLSYAELKARASLSETATLECISNNVGGPQISTAVFTGVSLRDLVTSAGARPAATTVGFKARDGYAESLPLSLVMDAPEILVAYLMNGAPLRTEHGFPARILIPGHYGMKGPKWLDEIELASQEVGGYWESQGWDHQAVVKTMARIDTPAAGDLVRAGSVAVAGVAFAGNRGVSSVEVSTDGGSSWAPADLRPPLSPLTWVLWTYAWHAVSGSHALKVRARDGAGSLQRADVAPSFPSGSSGYHTVQVDVSR